jgi:lysophospholipase L1-like esterase
MWTIRSPEPPLAAVAGLLAGLLAAGCGTTRDATTTSGRGAEAGALLDAGNAGGDGAAPPDSGAGDASAGDDAGSAAEGAADAGDADAGALAAEQAAEVEQPAIASGPPARGAELARFHAALRALERGGRASHVRIVWLGDSHAQADFWTGTLRTHLQKRFGNGGPGFVHVGFKHYRHDAVALTIDGKWKTRPKAPSATKTVSDGIFGLGGAMTSGFDESPRASVEVTDATLPPKLLVDLCYRLPTPADQAAVTVTGARRVNLKATAAEPAGPLRHLVLKSDVPTKVDVLPTSGRPELCGVVIETDPAIKPGVVLDTLGLNGARYATALAWNEESWGAELARRAPDLVILEYGTNEAGDHNVDPVVYGKRLTKLVARIRKVKPDVDVVVVGPSDRADTEPRIPPIRDALRAAAAENGCWFWDTYNVMGGKGSMRTWRDDKPPRAAKDGVHLVIRGYRELGDKLFADLMRGYK